MVHESTRYVSLGSSFDLRTPNMLYSASAMSLWVYDNTLTEALDLAKAFLVPLDALSALWPCSDQRKRYSALRKQLVDQCSKAGISSPGPPNLSLPQLSLMTI